MERFKIYGYTNLAGDRYFGGETLPISENSVKEITITDSELLSKFSTFNEKLTIEENDKISFSFDIYEEVDKERNPFLDLINPQSVLGLHLPDREFQSQAENDKGGAFYFLKVISRTPKFEESGVSYTISCEDFASKVYSKQGMGLNLDMTGSLREIAEEILGQTRKNNMYKDLNLDISNLSLSNLDSSKAKGMIYSLPYINFRGDIDVFKDMSYAKFTLDDRYIKGVTYDMHFDLVALNNTIDETKSIQAVFQVIGRKSNGIQTFAGELVESKFEDTPKPLRLPFTYEDSDFIELVLYENEEVVKDEKGNPVKDEKGNPILRWPWPQDGTQTISLTNFKIIKNKDDSEKREGNTSLLIGRLDNFFEQFSTSNGSYYSETKMTVSISNSNLYHALTSVAELFNAEVKFDYQYNSIYFVSKDFRRYNGLRLDPRLNLSSISRPESAEEFATILHLQGGDDVEGAIPSLPKEWREYLTACVDNNFIDEVEVDEDGKAVIIKDWFETYDSDNTYHSKIKKVASYINSDDVYEERVNEITKFARQLDKIPNFESTLYNFSYFYERDMIDKPSYDSLRDLLNNTMRKLNISLNISAYKYYSLYSQHASQLLQISFYIGAINTERRFQYNTHQRMTGEDAPREYTAAWVSYMNQIDASVAAERNYDRELRLILGLRSDQHLEMNQGSFIYNTLMIFGYEDENKNGIATLLKENEKRRNEKLQELAEEELLVKEYEDQLNDPDVSPYVKESISVDLAGARSRIDSIYRYLGQRTGTSSSGYFMPGIYTLEGSYYSEILDKLRAYPPKTIKSITLQEQSLYDLVVNRESEHNLVNKKEKELEVLMDKYESFSLEARYENSDEPTPFGLLEQGLNAFVKISYPRVSYNISAINIGALEEYKYIKHPEVGDKIKLPESLQLSYDTEEEGYLVVTGYSENLREIGSLSLSVEREDQSEILISRLLEQSNFVQVGGTKKRSNLVTPVPYELKNRLSDIDDSIKKLKESDISITELFNPMIKK